MKENHIPRSGLKKYFMACAVFFAFMMISIIYFFYCVQLNVVNTAERTIEDHVKRQRDHFLQIMDIHYRYLEGMARYIGRSGELLSSENMAILQSVVFEENNFERMAIIDRNGLSTYEDGIQKDVGGREYFQKAMKGKRALSDPIDSKVDGDRRVIMAVPVFRDGAVSGVLGGSYDVGFLSHLLFGDLYDGAGYTMIVMSSGNVISCDKDEEIRGDSDLFFGYYGAVKKEGDHRAKDLKEDFAAGRGGCVKFRTQEGDCYLVYEPLTLNDWMLCYAVPAAKVWEDFAFIRYYEVILCGVLLGGLAVLAVYVWKVKSREERALMQYAQTDALTGAVNKDSTQKQIDQWLGSGRTIGVQAFLMLDIDNFKTVNDEYGHGAGDEALRQIGKELAQEFREQDIVGRIGGDEFVVLIKNMAEEEMAVARVENLCRRIREITVKGIPGNILSCSVGVAYSPGHGNTYDKLYLCADKALYETKKRGRDGYTVYSGEETI